MIRPTLIRFISRITSSSQLSKPSSTIQLGRWNCNYDEAILENKVRWANEDHCGVCTNHDEKYIIIGTYPHNINININNKPQSNPQSNPQFQQKQPKCEEQYQDPNIFYYIADCCGNGCPNCEIYKHFMK